MGLGRRIVRKTVRKATPRPVRKAMHPVRTAKNAATPRSVKKISRGAYTVRHPIGAAENKAIGAVLYGGRTRRRPAARRAPVRRAPTYAQIQRQQQVTERAQKRGERDQQIIALDSLITALTSVHRQPFAPMERVVAERPRAHAASEYEAALRREHVAGLSMFQRSARREAQQRAAEQARAMAAAASTADEARWRREQAELDALWMKLVNGEPNMVLRTLNDAFADNETRTLAIAVIDGFATVIVVQPTIDAVPDQMPAVTPGGKPTLRKMTKTQRYGLWLQATMSSAAATLSEAFAVAPSVAVVRLIVVRDGDELLPVLVGEFTRADIPADAWAANDPGQTLSKYGDPVLTSPDRFGELRPLDLPPDLWPADLIQSLLRDPTPVTDPDIGPIVLPDLAGTSPAGAAPVLASITYQGLSGRFEVDGPTITILRVDAQGSPIAAPYPYPVRIPLADIVGACLLTPDSRGVGYLQVQAINDLRPGIDTITAPAEPYTVAFAHADLALFTSVAEWLRTCSGS